MLKVTERMGTLITLRESVFKQGVKISKNPIYPLVLSDLSIVNSIKMENLGETI